MVFVMLGIALAAYGVIVAIAVKSGVWFRNDRDADGTRRV
jgi:hypothetical protein